MARLVTSGFELNSVTSGIEVDGVITGSPTITSSPVRSGTYALSCNPSSATAYVQYFLYSANTSNKIFARAYVYINSLPNANTAVIRITNSAISVLASLVLHTDGTLTIQSGAGNIGSASGALGLNTWYCLELSVDASVSNGTVEGRINGNVFTNATGNNSTGAQRVLFGIITSTTANIVFDDIAINDGTGSSQTGYPSLGNIVRATPNIAGDSNTFGTQIGGTAGSSNNYTRVNETTPDDATSYNASAIAASDLFGVSVPTIPAGSTINCVVVGSRAADLVGADATASYQTQIEKTSGGTISQSSAIIPNSTSWKSNPQQPGASIYLHTLYNDPDGNPWTPSTIASMQVGYNMDFIHTQAIAVSMVWALVDYTPPTNNSGFFALF